MIRPLDYGLLRRAEYGGDDLNKLPKWDLFLSAYNLSERVLSVYQAAVATRKEWLILAQYGFGDGDLPTDGEIWRSEERDEAEFWLEYFCSGALGQIGPEASICVDVTGFMRPHLMLLPSMLRTLGFTRVDMLYSEPVSYKADENTAFAEGAFTGVRQVRGFEGIHVPDAARRDVLVIGAGYEDELIRQIAEEKRAAEKFLMFGLPSLQPHMYEENRLCTARDSASEALGRLPNRCKLFAPANDPFMTAQVLHDQVGAIRKGGARNIYLSPLATKAQALGFAFFYLCECIGDPVSVIFPYSERYSQETSVGLARVSWYQLELDWFI